MPLFKKLGPFHISLNPIKSAIVYFPCFKINSDVSSPTWNDIIFAGKVGAPRYSHDRAYCIIKGEWSVKEGVLSELAALGASKSYPNFSVLTKSEAQELASSETFVESE